MDKSKFNRPVSLRNVHLDDSFWKKEMELVRTQMIPYQWEVLNDRVEDADPSFCMRNFRVAAKMTAEKRSLGEAYEAPKYTFRGFEALPDDPDHLEDKFYGFVFQDSDFYKWVEAAAYSLTQHPDPELEAIADGAIDLVASAQQENGYLDTYYIINGQDAIFTNLKDHHELYCFGHLTEGAVAYYEATGKDKLLNVARRYADFIDSRFGTEEGKIPGYPGHEIAEMALIRLYEVTGEQRYLNLAQYFINQRGTQPYYFDREGNTSKAEMKKKIRYSYYQSHLPVREQKEAVGHAVRAVYLYSGMADAARLTGDESLKTACETLWNSITKEKMYITGGIGGTHIGESFSFPYDLPNDTAYAETCASIGLVFFARRMLEMDPDSRYADVMEQAVHNGIISGMALDGKSFFYVNPLSVLPEACHKDERKFHVKPVRRKWFGCACCPPNLARLISSIGSYAYTESEDTLFVHLYAGGTIEKTVGDTNAVIHVQSGFPWDGHVEIAIQQETPVQMTIALRIPGWCGDDFELTGAVDKECRMEKGYLYVTGTFARGDSLHINFPMNVQVLESNAKVTENAGKLAVRRGPVVYCLEERDNGADLAHLSLKGTAEFTIEETEEFGEKVVVLKAQGKRELPAEQDDALYHVYRRPVQEDVTLRFIPYYTWANRGENEMEVWVSRS